MFCVVTLIVFPGRVARGASTGGAESPHTDHWAFQPLSAPAIPKIADATLVGRARNPIDAFVIAKAAERGLALSLEADRRTLIRRVSYDLIGLPPTPEEVDVFLADPDPQAYEKLVDRLLASPRYGERWARHWLDIVHYGDTHGYDKDKVRPNAWPYRDYVVRSFNDDKPYSQFVKEQLAGDFYAPNTADGAVALGFIAAGPFDYVGQVELREGTIDQAITRNLDRDDMVATTMNTFVSLTAQCARCHDHKFDPIKQEDYYSLQAVFAAVDRAERPYDADPVVAKNRQDLRQQIQVADARRAELETQARTKAGSALAAVEAQIANLSKPAADSDRPEFGYHSEIASDPSMVKWVQVDLGQSMRVARIRLIGAYDTFAGIGAGFGFPARFKVETSDDPTFASHVTTVVDHTADDVANPGTTPQDFAVAASTARYVRVTATKLALRQNDYAFALGELSVYTPEAVNVAAGKTVTAKDSIEAAPRWGGKNLVDGYFHGTSRAAQPEEIAKLTSERRRLMDAALDEADRVELRQLEKTSADASAALKALPPATFVFAAATHFEPVGSLRPTEGKARPIHILRRGSEKDPGAEVGPGTVAAIPELQSSFDSFPDDEPRRRAALAEWIVDRRNPLTWRSIVNRVWQYHFGRGIVETPNDFGRMGATPTHPELLDYLAAGFRDGGQSIKALHRLIVTSSTYRQTSADNPAFANVDGGNQYLWRMNRRRLEAEATYDTILSVAGKLDLKMGGPGYRDFAFEDDHSPRYKYQDHDPDDPATHRRSIYRLIVRSAPNPFLETLDCADPSQIVPKRNETLTPLQALALMNDRFVIRMAEHFAARVQGMAPNVQGQIDAAFRLALCRPATVEERALLGDIAAKHGLASACRLILNTNEFSFVD